MSLAGIYFFLALLSAYCTLTAIVQARRLYALVPVYFFSAWLCIRWLIRYVSTHDFTAFAWYRIAFGEPMYFEGDPDDDDDVIAEKVWLVRSTVQNMVNRGLREREHVFW